MRTAIPARHLFSPSFNQSLEFVLCAEKLKESGTPSPEVGPALRDSSSTCGCNAELAVWKFPEVEMSGSKMLQDSDRSSGGIWPETAISLA